MCLSSKRILSHVLTFVVACWTCAAYAQTPGDAFEGQGRLVQTLVESLDGVHSDSRYVLNLSELHAVALGVSELPQGISAGALVRILGTWQMLPGFGLAVQPQQIQQLAPPIGPDQNAVLGSRSSVAIKVNFNDATVSCSESQISDRLWNGALNIRAFYETTTYGLLTFPNDVDGNNQPDIYTLSLNSSINPCNQNSWMNSANSALTSLGVNLAQYQHRIYIFPEAAASTCGFAGQATVGCFGTCWMISNYCSLQDVFIHELGHNLGMNHAAIDSNNDGSIDNVQNGAYGDYSCPMGIAGIGWRHFNAAHKSEMGWIPPERTAALTSSGTYYIASVDIDPVSASPPPPAQTQILTYAVPGQSGQTYYFSFRRSDSSYSQNLQSAWSGKTNVHRFSGSGYTLFVRALADGEGVDLGSGVQISQLQSGSNWSQVQITLPGATPTVGPTPTATATPTRTATPTPTRTATPTRTPTPTATATSAVSATATPIVTEPTATPIPQTSPPAEFTPTPEPSPTATATPSGDGRFRLRGSVRLPKTQRILYPKLRVRIDGPATQRRFVNVSNTGRFSIELAAGQYRLRAQAKPGVKIPRRVRFAWQTVLIPEDLSLSLTKST